MNRTEYLSINALRVLSADAVQKANSGHPGLPLGSAPMAYELWAHHLRHNPDDPDWINRDRFILSAGHGSMLLYALLYLYGYGDISLTDIKSFRQLNSRTPGHPEYRHTPGVEATTGPLGAGMGMAVGMAIAEKHLAAVFNEAGYPVFDHYTFALGGDGCMMEGISSEAFSLAGTLGLSKLIILYDSNKISIEGSTDLAFTEDVQMRMEAFGFQTLDVADGNDIAAIGRAIAAAKADQEKPSFITVHTEIGYGCPNKQGHASAHGEPLGADNVQAMKANLGWPSQQAFEIPKEVYDNYRALRDELIKSTGQWQTMFQRYGVEYPGKKTLLEQYFDPDYARKQLDGNDDFWKRGEQPEATRAASGRLLNVIKDDILNIIGGSADLAPSNKTVMNQVAAFSKDTPAGRNLHFGVRELAMAAIGNGIMLHGGLYCYVATFLVFSDYLKPMARLAAIMKLPMIFVFSHDSIGVGEDGPTHEPVEQLAMLRAMPNFHLFRPCDATETAAAWYSALTSRNTPTAIVLSRQTLAVMPESSNAALQGGYILSDCEGTPELILIATGSEVALAVAAKHVLAEKGRQIRVVSMPCMDLFEAQSDEYKEAVLPDSVTRRIAVEALAVFGWDRYVGRAGKTIGMTTFGASGPSQELFEHFGFTVAKVVATAESLLITN